MNKNLISGVVILTLVVGGIWGLAKLRAQTSASNAAIATEAYNAAQNGFTAALTKKLAEQAEEDNRKFAELRASIEARDAVLVSKLIEIDRKAQQTSDTLNKKLNTLKDGPLSEQAVEYFKDEKVWWEQ